MPTLLSIEALEADRQYVERQLSEVGNDPWGTARIMGEMRLAELRQQIAERAAERSAFASVAVIFDGNPVIGSNNIRLDFTADALDSYEKLMTIAMASSTDPHLPERGRVPGAEQSRLFIRDVIHGSMGFILEEVAPEQQELLPTALKAAVENTTQSLNRLSSVLDEEFNSIFGEAQSRLVSSVQRFAKVVYQAGASTRILRRTSIVLRFRSTKLDVCSPPQRSGDHRRDDRC